MGCKKTENEVELFEGISKDGMVRICAVCAEREGVPLIRKPSYQQLEPLNENVTVRERMERLSGLKKKKETDERLIIHGNSPRLRTPAPKESHPDLIDNYSWELIIARRRKKLTTNQLANQIGVEVKLIEDFEKGHVPRGHQEIAQKLESKLGIKLLTIHPGKVSFNAPARNKEEDILREVKERMAHPENYAPLDETKIIRSQKKESIEKGDFDFSKRENVENLTLSDLVDIKREREKREAAKKRRVQTDTIIGDDLQLENDEIN